MQAGHGDGIRRGKIPHTQQLGTGPKISKYTGFHEWLFSDDLFPAGVKFTFHQETLACVQAEVFMGLWQLLAAAEVLRRTTDVVFRVRGWEVLCRMHHKKIQPHHLYTSLYWHLMWSSLPTGKIKQRSTGQQTTSCHCFLHRKRTCHMMIWRQQSSTMRSLETVDHRTSTYLQKYRHFTASHEEMGNSTFAKWLLKFMAQRDLFFWPQRSATACRIST